MLELLAVAAAGAAAGASNSLAGAGSLITFPTLVALGVPPLSANVTSTVGLIPGAAGGAIGYADLLGEQRQRVVRLAVPTLLGAAAGTALLLLTSDDTFEAIVPALVAGSCLLLLFQPRLTAADRPRRRRALALPHRRPRSSPAPTPPTSAPPSASSCSALLGLFVADSMQHLNGLKILLAGLANLLAAVAYAFLAAVDWRFAVCLMVSSLVGGRLGAKLARRVSGDVLRVAIALIGLVVAAVLAWRAFG